MLNRIQGVNRRQTEFPRKTQVSGSKDVSYNHRSYSLLLRYMCSLAGILKNQVKKIWISYLILLSPLEAYFLSRYSSVITLIILLGYYLVSEIYSDFSQIVYLTNHITARVWNGQDFVEEAARNLSPGAIVFLEENDLVPADVLALCISSQKSSENLFNFLGEKIEEERIPTKRTQSLLYNESESSFDFTEVKNRVSRLELIINYSEPDPDIYQTKGSIKVSRDPTLCRFDYKNVLLMGNTVKGDNWIIGTVLFSQSESKRSLQFTQQVRKMGNLHKSINIVMALYLGLFVVFAGTSIIVNSQDYLFTLLQYAQIVPAFAFIAIEIVGVIFKVFLSTKNIKVNQTDSLSAMSETEYLLIDKSECLGHEPMIEYCVIGKACYYREGTQDQLTTDNTHLSFTDLSNQLVFKNEKPSRSLHLAVALSFSETSYSKNILKDFSRSLDIELLHNSEEIVGFNVGKTHYNVSVVAFEVLNGVTVSVIDWENVGYVLYSKGDKNSIMNTINLSTTRKNWLLNFLTSKEMGGSKQVLYAYRILSQKEAVKFNHEYKVATLSPINRKGRTENAFERILNCSELLGIIGIKERIANDVVPTIESLDSIKTWILSGDSEEPVIASAVSASVIKYLSNVVYLKDVKDDFEGIEVLDRHIDEMVFLRDTKGNNDSQDFNMPADEFNKCFSSPLNKYRGTAEIGNSQMRKSFISKVSLHPLMRSVTKKNLKKTVLKNKAITGSISYSLVVDAQILQYLMSPLCLKRFTMLLFFADSVVFYRLMPYQKAKVAKLLRENFRFHPLVMSVGNHASNIPLFNESATSVSYFGPPSNVKIRSFSKILDLLQTGRRYSEAVKSVFLIYFYLSLLATSCTFMYNISFNQSTVALIEYEEINFLQYLFLTVPAICVGISKENRETKLVREMGILCMVALFQSFIICFMNSWGLNGAINKDGQVESFDVMRLLTFIQIEIIALIAMAIESNRLVSILGVCTGILIIVLHLGIANEMSSSFQDLVPMLSLLNWIKIFCNSLVCGVIYIIGKLFANRRDVQLAREDEFSSDASRVFLKSSDSAPRVEEDNVEVGLFRLKFKQPLTEAEYKSLRIEENLKMYRIFYAMSCLVFTVSTVYSVVQTEDHFLLLILLVVPYLILGYSFTENFAYILATLILFAYVILSTYAVYFITSVLIEPILALQLTFFFIPLKSNWLLTLSIAVFLLIPLHSFQDLPIDLIGLLGLLALVSYNTDLSERKRFSMTQKYQIEMEKSHNALSYLLPDFVKKRVKDGDRSMAEDQGIVSILFCYICDFDYILTEYTPQELTFFMDDLFCKFDALCLDNGVAKIETVGNTYLACAGLHHIESEFDASVRDVPHARRAVEMGFSLLKVASKITLKDGRKLSLKIGIHSGHVVAGILGHHKPQFSLVGDTVNTASRMSSTSPENEVQISSWTFQSLVLTDGLRFEENEIPVKGKGMMKTYYVKIALGMSQNRSAEFDCYRNAEAYGHKKISMFEYPCPRMKPRKSTLLDMVGVNQGSELFRRFDTGIDQVKCFSLTCDEAEKEKEFRLNIQKDQFYFHIVELATVAVLLNTKLIISCTIRYSELRIIFESIGILAFSSMAILHWKFNKSRFYSSALQVLFSLALIQSIVLSYMSDSSSMLEPCLYIVLSIHCTNLFVKHMIILTISSAFCFLVFYESPIALISFCLQVFLCLVNQYRREKALRVYFSLKAIADAEFERSEELNAQMMPAPAFARFKEGKQINDWISKVTLIYADIVGFTSWSDGKSPREVIRMLSHLFMEFDKNCQKFSVYKVHTIGDCYVAMSYTGNSQRDVSQEAVNIIRFAQSMLEVIDYINFTESIQLNMRIGVHTGDVICALPGTNIVRYDIYGLDVAVANECESNGRPGAIFVSQTTKDIIQSSDPSLFEFTHEKELPSKICNIPLFSVS